MKNILNTLLKQLTFGMYDFPRQEGKSASRSNILGTHWRKIPNVKEFSVKVSTWNIIFHFFGMSKRNKPTITWTPHDNSKFNNYMTRQVKRLLKLRENPGNNGLNLFSWSICSFSFLLLAVQAAAATVFRPL